MVHQDSVAYRPLFGRPRALIWALGAIALIIRAAQLRADHIIIIIIQFNSIRADQIKAAG